MIYTQRKGNITTLAEAYAKAVKVEQQFSPQPLAVNPLDNTLPAVSYPNPLNYVAGLQNVNAFTLPSLPMTSNTIHPNPMLSYYLQSQIVVASTTNTFVTPPIISAIPSLPSHASSNPRPSFLPKANHEALIASKGSHQ